MIQHKALAEGKWKKLSLSQQMANIGSEVERTIKWKNKGNNTLSKNAFNRCIELINISLSTTDKLPTLKEFTRTKELLIDHFIGTNTYKTTDESWKKYFYQFALYCNNNK